MAQQNKELLSRIDTLSKQKNYPVKTDGLSNDQLQEVLTELERAPDGGTAASNTRATSAGGAARKAVQGADERLPDGGGTEALVTTETVGDAQPNGGIRPNASTDVLRAQREGRLQERSEPKTFQYAVAPGRSITTARGHLDAGSEVRLDDVGGQQRLDDLIKRGVIVSGSGQQQGGATTTTVATGTTTVQRAGTPGAPSTSPTGEGGNKP